MQVNDVEVIQIRVSWRQDHYRRLVNCTFLCYIKYLVTDQTDSYIIIL